MKTLTSKSACRMCTGDLRVSRGPRACVCPNREERAAALPSKSPNPGKQTEKKRREYEALVASGKCINCREPVEAASGTQGHGSVDSGSRKRGSRSSALRCAKCKGNSTRQRFAKAANKVRAEAEWDKLRCRRVSLEQVAAEMARTAQRGRETQAGGDPGAKPAGGAVPPCAVHASRTEGALVFW